MRCTPIGLLLLAGCGNHPDLSWSYAVEKARALGSIRAVDRYVDRLEKHDYVGTLRGIAGTIWDGGCNDVEREFLRDALYEALGEAPLRRASGVFDRHGVEVEARHGDVTVSHEGPSAMFCDNPAVLRFHGSYATLERLKPASGRGGATPMRLAAGPFVLTITITSPGDRRKTIRIDVKERRGAHAVCVWGGKVSRWALAREKKRVSRIAEPAASAYLLGLAYAAKVDRLLPELARARGTIAYHRRPRVIVAWVDRTEKAIDVRDDVFVVDALKHAEVEGLYRARATEVIVDMVND